MGAPRGFATVLENKHTQIESTFEPHSGALGQDFGCAEIISDACWCLGKVAAFIAL